MVRSAIPRKRTNAGAANGEHTANLTCNTPAQDPQQSHGHSAKRQKLGQVAETGSDAYMFISNYITENITQEHRGATTGLHPANSFIDSTTSLAPSTSALVVTPPSLPGQIELWQEPGTNTDVDEVRLSTATEICTCTICKRCQPVASSAPRDSQGRSSDASKVEYATTLSLPEDVADPAPFIPNFPRLDAAKWTAIDRVTRIIPLGPMVAVPWLREDGVLDEADSEEYDDSWLESCGLLDVKETVLSTPGLTPKLIAEFLAEPSACAIQGCRRPADLALPTFLLKYCWDHAERHVASERKFCNYIADHFDPDAAYDERIPWDHGWRLDGRVDNTRKKYTLCKAMVAVVARDMAYSGLVVPTMISGFLGKRLHILRASLASRYRLEMDLIKSGWCSPRQIAHLRRTMGWNVKLIELVYGEKYSWESSKSKRAITALVDSCLDENIYGDPRDY